MYVCVYVYVFMCGARIYTYIWSTPRHKPDTARAGSAHESRQVTHIHAHAHAQTHTHIYICMCKYTYNIIYLEHSTAQTWHSTRKKRTRITSSHTRTRVHTHTHTHTHIYVCTYTYVYVYTRIIYLEHTTAQTWHSTRKKRTQITSNHTHTRARTHTYIYICTDTCISIYYTYNIPGAHHHADLTQRAQEARTVTSSYTLTRARTHTRARARAHTHTYIYTHGYAYTHIIYLEHTTAQTWHSTRKKRAQVTSSHTGTREQRLHQRCPLLHPKNK